MIELDRRRIDALDSATLIRHCRRRSRRTAKPDKGPTRRPRPAPMALAGGRDLGGGHGADWRTGHRRGKASLAAGWRELEQRAHHQPRQRAARYSFTCRTLTATFRCRWQYGNENGFGAWSNTGTIDAGDITERPAADRAHVHGCTIRFDWPWPQATRARVEMHGGAGGGGQAAAVAAAALDNSGNGGAGGGGGGGGTAAAVAAVAAAVRT